MNQDPNGFVMVGNDTLGRDWGAMAAERERMAAANAVNSNEIAPVLDYANLNAKTAPENTNYYSGSLLQNSNPYAEEKLDQNNYTSIEAGDGREIITGYEREEEKEPIYRFQTRHQKETGKSVVSEPQIKFKE